MTKVNLEIDGISLEAETGSMIIEVADRVGISIPRFCYHKKLSVAANCRQCLVDVSNLPKAVPACATPVADGMVIFTQSDKARDAQKSVMEFLLINHPLDCPICDQGGECELQDVAMSYGRDVSRFTEGKRVVKDKNLGPLIHTDMTRCIHCTRCVRFGTEVAGIRELGATGRGEHMEIGTFLEQNVDSEVSGNVIDLCPVGALVAKPSRFRARAWEMMQKNGVSPHDCLGSNLHIHCRRGEVIRVVPRENEAINETWISDRDRFSYAALNSEHRLTLPRIKQQGQWREVDWQTALEFTRDGLQQIRSRYSASHMGALASPCSSLEELYLLQKLMRGIGCDNVDHRLRIQDFSHQEQAPLFPQLGLEIKRLEQLDGCLLIGSNLRKEQPLAAVRLRKATRYGKVIAVNSYDCHYNFKLEQDFQVADDAMLSVLSGIAAALLQQRKDVVGVEIRTLFDDITVSEEEQAAAQTLLDQEQVAVIVGHSGLEHSQAGHLLWLAELIAKLAGASFGVMSHGGNSAGAWLAGALPHRRASGHSLEKPGLNAQEMLLQPRRAYVLLNCEPERDALDKAQARAAMEQADFVVSLTPFADGETSDYADVMLPIGAFTEIDGTYVNCQGDWQSVAAAVKPKGEARPAWKVLRVLGNLLQVRGFDYVHTEDVMLDVRRKFEGISAATIGSFPVPEQLKFGGTVPPPANIYDVDLLVRRSPPLQKTLDANTPMQEPTEQVPPARVTGEVPA